MYSTCGTRAFSWPSVVGKRLMRLHKYKFATWQLSLPPRSDEEIPVGIIMIGGLGAGYNELTNNVNTFGLSALSVYGNATTYAKMQILKSKCPARVASFWKKFT